MDPSDHRHHCPEHGQEWEVEPHERWRQHRWEDHNDQRGLLECTTKCPGLKLHKYVEGDIVWIIETGPPEYEEHCPRQMAVILKPEGKWLLGEKVFPPESRGKYDEMYIIEVDPADSEDDGLREVQINLIEGLANNEEQTQWNTTHRRQPTAVVYLADAQQYLGIDPEALPE